MYICIKKEKISFTSKYIILIVVYSMYVTGEEDPDLYKLAHSLFFRFFKSRFIYNTEFFIGPFLYCSVKFYFICTKFLLLNIFFHGKKLSSFPNVFLPLQSSYLVNKVSSIRAEVYILKISS